MIFAPNVPHSERVLPSEETGWGSVYYHPPDGTNGEATYDPFAFDVACMGGILCEAIGVSCSIGRDLTYIEVNENYAGHSTKGSSFGPIPRQNDHSRHSVTIHSV